MSLLKANAVQLGQSLTATNNFVLYQPATPDGTVRLGNGNSGSVTDLVTLTSAGNLGIGTSSPGTKVDIGSGTLRIKNASTDLNGLLIYQAASDTSTIFNYYSGPLVFGTNNTERARIDSSGNLLIGVTSYNAGVNANFQLFGAGNGTWYTGHASGTTSGTTYADFRYSGTTIGSISQSGTNSVLFNTSSDQRLKTNISPAGSAIQSILNFPVDQFDWISSGEHQDFGAVAQKAYKVIPEMVSVPADPEEMWGIDWSKSVPRLIKTIQELSAELNELKQKVNA